ncbi:MULTISPECIES: methylenetetrahydrofolate reductase [NAD(P)H] [Hymenobacter]|uniref:Methylenetetrahydrofolate reductase n=1 Tax=Hymenobacter jejuensis TaxID=2502781 RepID=A0A5B7ZZS1_9BACT|nr:MULTISPECIES: methylenetetrahydrofolate reductase [NAD(P)H] [Hymenobacter]MBC6991316.1 methylenetetrahydrofolate reductase [NAD(P)H] [Hymenobacter sp. BT491]QDA60319.1 methylenetetrahydrofolate reductase [NAD(P)H] [Hymenobacter jejuensis]
MKVTEHLERANGKTLFSFEVLPPRKGENIKNLFSNIEPLMEFKPPFIDVTYHREEYAYRKRPGGLLEKVTVRKRPGTVGICAAIKNRFDVDTVPHLICGGFSKEETENALIDLHFLGIDNVLALRGDPIKTESHFVPDPNGHAYASDLIAQVACMNKGHYLDEEQEDSFATDFCIGTAGYPEKHFEAPNYGADMRYLKQKVERGANYIVTQMFFDNEQFFAFEKKCRAAGINVPIIPGLKPMTTKSQLTMLPRTFYLNIPEALAEAVHDAPDNAAARDIGIEWCINQSKELMAHGVPCLHYYSMGKAESIRRVAAALF